jgi:hypothetical protein
LKIPEAKICLFYWNIYDFAVDCDTGLHYKFPKLTTTTLEVLYFEFTFSLFKEALSCFLYCVEGTMFDRLDCDVEGNSATFSVISWLCPCGANINHHKSSDRTDDIFAGHFYFYSLLLYLTPLDMCAYTEH